MPEHTPNQIEQEVIPRDDFLEYYIFKFPADLNTFMTIKPRDMNLYYSDRYNYTIQYKELTGEFTYLSFLNSMEIIFFADALSYQLLLDKVCYNHFNEDYDKFDKVTKFPKFIQNKKVCDYKIPDIFKAIGIHRRDVNQNHYPHSTELEQLMNILFKYRLPDFDLEKFCLKCKEQLSFEFSNQNNNEKVRFVNGKPDVDVVYRDSRTRRHFSRDRLEFMEYYLFKYPADRALFLKSIPEGRYHMDKFNKTIQDQVLGDKFDRLSFLTRKQVHYFRVALCYEVLFDQVYYTYFKENYDKFNDIMRFPKYTGNCFQGSLLDTLLGLLMPAHTGCRSHHSHKHPAGIGRSRNINRRLFLDIFEKAAPFMMDVMQLLFKNKLPEIDFERYWQRCLDEFPVIKVERTI